MVRMVRLFTAALLVCTAITPVAALDVSVGGAGASGGSSGDGGTTVSAGSGNTSATATIGGGNNVANGAVGNSASVGIGTNPGNLITTNTDNGTASGRVNLGGVAPNGNLNNAINGATGPAGNILGNTQLPTAPGLPGLPGLPGIPGGGGVTPTQVSTAFAGLSMADQQLLRARCAQVLAAPASFDAGTVSLCRIIARL